ncbi:hypothetical protein Goklo_004751, partial [Gossypium klotzschianum]|nr:hypothetical protein [Gossypium klotzschianum]
MPRVWPHNKIECVNNLKKKKKALYVTWSDDDSSSGFDLKDDHQNFITFISNAENEEFDIETCGEIDEDFLKTYKEMMGKWAMVCEINIQLSQENKYLKDENVALTNQVATKEALPTNELSNIVKIECSSVYVWKCGTLQVYRLNCNISKDIQWNTFGGLQGSNLRK